MMYRYPTALALAALLSSTSSAQAQVLQPYTLTYDAADGSLTIDTFAQPLYNYIIIGTGDLATDDGFIETNHLLIPDATGPQQQSATSMDDELSQSDFNGWFGLAPQNLGNVLAPGLSEAEFNAAIDPNQTKYVRQLGSNGFPDFFYNFDIVYNVPEPNSIVLFGLGAAMLVQRRRRRI